MSLGLEADDRVEVTRGPERRRSGRRRQPRAAQAGDARRAQAGGRRAEESADVALLPSQPVPHHRRLADRHRRRPDERGANAGRPVPRHQHPAGRRARRSTTACRPSRSRTISRAASSGSSRSARASITWSRGRCRASASSACSSSRARTPTPTSREISNLAMADLRRLPPGTLPPVVQKFDASSLPVALITLEGRGPVGNPAARHRPVHHPQSARGRARRLGAAAVRREVPPDHGLRRSGQAAGVPDEPDGRRARGQQREPDSAVRRREDRPARLHALHEQPVPERPRHQPHSAQDGRERIDGPRERRRARGGRAARFRTTSCRSTASGRRFCR